MCRAFVQTQHAMGAQDFRPLSRLQRFVWRAPLCRTRGWPDAKTDPSVTRIRSALARPDGRVCGQKPAPDRSAIELRQGGRRTGTGLGFGPTFRLGPSGPDRSVVRIAEFRNAESSFPDADRLWFRNPQKNPPTTSTSVFVYASVSTFRPTPVRRHRCREPKSLADKF